MAALAAGPAARAQASALPAPTCSPYTLPARIADPGPADQTLWGQLCYRGAHEPSTVQLLVHGATYNHLYWNLPYGNGYYSYVDAATGAGYATFDIDRVGDGHSSHPPRPPSPWTLARWRCTTRSPRCAPGRWTATHSSM